MLKYWACSKEKCSKGSGLTYLKNPEMQWILVTNPNEAELKAISEDFKINKKYLEKYSKETRSVKYSNNPLIFTLISYYLENNQMQRARVLFVIEKNNIIIIANSGEKYFSVIFNDVCEKFETEKKKDIEVLIYDFLDRDISENYDILANLDDNIAKMEVSALEYNSGKNIQNVINLKRELNKMSRRLWSTAKIVFAIRKEVTVIRVTNESMGLLEDIYENLIHQIDILSTQKESLIDALTIYETTVSNQLAIINNDLNTVMKRLTILMLLLMVPTLIAGIYGMNFKYIPELTSPYGFFEAIIIMIIATATLYFYAKRKKWV
ncbi:MAG: hypothetical protein COT15_02905 [Candidatus Diapherotrites archaeon CG08_land_8_20_14_0_20_34_12]|nr:MAG: hypothetical protein COT15_02905 [Candidatus Diapherotrites archaeon CG08_land_8_20_14_0_20_34_12]